MSKKTDQQLKKCDELIERLKGLKKALNASANLRPVTALGPGWSQDPTTGVLHHPEYGLVSTSRRADGDLEIRHDGNIVAKAADMTHAGVLIKNLIHLLNSKSSLQKTAAQVKNPTARPQKTLTPEQIAMIEEAKSLKKSATNLPWIRHGSVPNADQEVQKIQRENPAIPGEDAMAGQLAAMMNSRAMMRPDHRQPSSDEMLRMGQAMGLGASEEMLKTADAAWGNTMNSWLQEAVKPISARFASEEEELAYWNSIKVHDRSGGGNDYGF